MQLRYLFIGAALMLGLTACDDDEPRVIEAEFEAVEGATPDPDSRVSGFYVLNEGNMGSNKCTLDYFNCLTAEYARNVYSQANPDAIMELGDTGNDIAVHGNRLFVIVNGSHKVEVLDASTATSIRKIDVPTPRYIAFDGKHAYVTSYVSAKGDNGSVYRINLDNYAISGITEVGLSPEEMVVADGYLYVANSCNFSSGRFDNTISVIDLKEFKVKGTIEVDGNMHHLRADSEGNLWVNTRDFADIHSNLYKLPKEGPNQYATPIAVNVPCEDFVIDGNRILYYATVYDENWNATNSYGIVNVATAKAEPGSFITDGTESSIVTPYALAVEPGNGNILITDANNYTSSGTLRCYSAAGKLRWSVRTGDIPGAIAFVNRLR